MAAYSFVTTTQRRANEGAVKLYREYERIFDTYTKQLVEKAIQTNSDNKPTVRTSNIAFVLLLAPPRAEETVGSQIWLPKSVRFDRVAITYAIHISVWCEICPHVVHNLSSNKHP